MSFDTTAAAAAATDLFGAEDSEKSVSFESRIKPKNYFQPAEFGLMETKEEINFERKKSNEGKKDFDEEMVRN